MSTFTIRRNDKPPLDNLSAATSKMSWKKSFVMAGDQKVAGHRFYDGFPADIEYHIDDGDEIVEVDEEGNEIARETFTD
jgi:hypothetical protein